MENNKKDYTALFALLHTIYNTTACVVHTGKTHSHTDYMGGHTRIVPLNARLPNMLCKVRKRADDATRYNLKLQKIALIPNLSPIRKRSCSLVFNHNCPYSDIKCDECFIFER